MLLKVVNFIFAGMFVFTVFLAIGLSLPDRKVSEKKTIKLYNGNTVIYNYNTEGVPDGVIFAYRPDGSVEQKMFFENGELVKITRYNANGEIIPDPSSSLPEWVEKQEHATSDPFHQSAEVKHHNSDIEQ